MNHLDYLDFEVEIGQPTGQEYPLTVLRSPAGEARVTLTWPFDELELENRLKDLQIALLSSGGVRRSLLTPAEVAVQRFGVELFDLLFIGEVRNRYDVSQERVHHQEKGLRLKLRIQDPRLANLPWEFLYDVRRDEYLCLSQQTPLVRYLELPQTIRPLAVTPPLRILGMVAGPSDLQALDLQVERQRLERAITPLHVKGLVQLHWLEGATWRDLQRCLRREPWHIFHFIGHGSFDVQRDEGVIAFCNDDNKAHLLSAGDLGRLLADQRTLRLAVLNACLGAHSSNRDLFSGVAATLVRRGISAVVAMQQAITDAAAIEFTQTFYESLADGLPVDAAMSEARKAISFALTNTLEWGTPVLYSRASDGQLFTVDSIDSATTVPPPLAQNLPGRGEDDQQSKEPAIAPSRKADDPSRSPASLPSGPIVSEEERLAAEKGFVEHAKRQVCQDDAPVSLKNTTDQSSTTKKRQWAKLTGGLAAVILVGYLGVLGVDLYQRYQRHIAFTALAKTVETRMVQTAPQLQPLIDRFNIGFVPVPADSFLMGSPEGVGEDDEHPQFSMTIDAPFWISLTEVTNAQYQHFIEAKGYGNPEWWTAAGLQWKTEQSINQPAYWTDSKWNSPEQPVVGVSWYEATAYARWLASETKLAIRLPTEAEWEKAARGPDGQTYPWDNEIPMNRLLNYNNNIGQTVDVGSYLDGASPYGVLDMAGNVWEWTATKWVENYENYVDMVNSDKEGGVTKTLRGGSWKSNADEVRVTNRIWNFPKSREDNIGFRLVFVLGP